MYLQKNYIRFIALSIFYTLQGEDCYCYADIGTESTLMDQVASSQCNIACAGNPGQKCGGATAGTVLVAKCEQGWTRFGEKCLKEITFDNLDTEGLKFTDGIQTCAAVSPFFSKSITSNFFVQYPGGTLWFPSSQTEAQFVIDSLWSRTDCTGSDYCYLYYGLKSYSDKLGWMGMDNSLVPGIPLILSKY